MMEKPKPIDLLIEPESSPQLYLTVRIEAHTEEAQRWIEANAREFGNLYAEPLRDDRRVDGRRVKWNLWLYAAYDRAQVIEWLIYKWESDRWPAELESEAVSDGK